MSKIEKQDKKINKDEADLIDKLVGINRVAKVVKGGRRLVLLHLLLLGIKEVKLGLELEKPRKYPKL